MARLLDRREERAKRRTVHIAELRKRGAEADAKLKRLYDAIENGIADVSDPMLKERVTELKAIRDRPAPTQSGPRARSIGSGRASHRAGAENLRQPGAQAQAD